MNTFYTFWKQAMGKGLTFTLLCLSFLVGTSVLSAKDFTLSKHVGGIQVDVSAGEGVLPNGTTLTVKQLSDTEKTPYIKELQMTKGIAMPQAIALDITLWDANGNEIQPQGEVNVKVSGASFSAENPKKFAVFHAMPNNSEAGFELERKSLKQIEKEQSGKQIFFATSHFSVYLLGTTNTATYEFYVDGTLVQTQILLDGETLLVPEVPEVPAGKKFKGWKIDGTTDITNPISVTTTETVRVEAVFEDMYNVTYLAPNKSFGTVEVAPGDLAEDRYVMLDEEFWFNYWSETEGGDSF